MFKTRYDILAEMWLVLKRHLLIAVFFKAQFIFKVGSALAQKMVFDKVSWKYCSEHRSAVLAAALFSTPAHFLLPARVVGVP